MILQYSGKCLSGLDGDVSRGTLLWMRGCVGGVLGNGAALGANGVGIGANGANFTAKWGRHAGLPLRYGIYGYTIIRY